MQLDLGLLAFSFSAGVAAFFNPCGFALLPSYVSYYLGTNEEGSTADKLGMLQGLVLGLTVSAGFLVVFSLIGVVLSLVGGLVARFLPWVAALIGVALVVLGFLMLLGRSITLPWHLDGLVQAQLKEHQKQQGLVFYFFYGMSYALASISCTIPIFIVIVAQAFSLGTLNGLVNFAAYGLGMAAMMVALSLTMSVSKQAIKRYFQPLMRVMQPLSAVVLIAAGGYLVYYNLIYSGLLWR